MTGFIAAVFLIIGLINVTSETPVFFGWIAIIVGAILFVMILSGPYKRPILDKKNIAGGTAGGVSGSGSSSGSDYSGGDGGGCGGGGD